MAWNPSPKVAAARDFGQKFDAQQVVILAVRTGGAPVEIITYGKTKRLCDGADTLGQIAWQAICDAMEDDDSDG